MDRYSTHGFAVKMRFSDFWLIKDGLLSENWVMTGDYGVLIQLGVDPLARIDKTWEIPLKGGEEEAKVTKLIYLGT